MMPLAGGEERPLDIRVTRLTTFDVTPSGIYFITPEKEGPVLMRSDLDGNGRRRIQLLGRGVWYGLSVSPDGKAFLYSVTEPGGHDLMLVENFR